MTHANSNQTPDKANALRTVRNESIMTIIASGLVIAMNMAFIGWLSRDMPKTDFECFLLARRLITFIFPFTSLSIGVGLTRALAKHADSPNKQRLIQTGATPVMFVFSLAVLLTACLVPIAWIQRYALPLSDGTKVLWIAMFVWLLGYTGNVTLYSFFRGLIQMRMANAVNVIANGVLPLVVLAILHVFKQTNPTAILLVWGCAQLTTYPLLLIVAGSPRNPRTACETFMTETLPYSLPRIPAGVLLSLPGYVVPFFLVKNGKDAVYLLSGMLVTQIVFYLADPLGQVFLPRSTRWSETNQTEHLSGMCDALLEITVFFGLILTGQALIWGDVAASLWFGEGFAETGRVIRLLSIAIVPAFLFSPLKSTLDGVEKKPLITYFLFAAAVFVTGACLIFHAATCLNTLTACLILVAYHFILATLLLIALAKRVKISIKKRFLWESLAISLILLFSSASIHALVGPRSTAISVASIIVSGCVCSLVSFAWIKARRPSWLAIATRS